MLIDRDGHCKITDFGVPHSSPPQTGGRLFLSPERQPASPAGIGADLYTATAVFLWCLGGAGSRPDVIAQLPGPLRSLILHAMAGEPAERPRSAAALRADLGTTATSAYGATWKDDGTGMLRGRAAALLALLLPGPAAAGVTTTLAPKAAIASRAGVSGWQFATACAAVFVVVFGAVAGAVVG